ncbi:MAG: class II aldolase/adducin family protein [Sphaerochaetaceae bacterium]
MIRKDYLEERQSVATFMARLYNRQLTTAGGGNISLRLSDELFCITPTSLDKSELKAEDIALVTFEGRNLTPECELSSETEMHRLILKERKDVNAIVHAHPVFASSFTSLSKKGLGCPIDTHILAEAYYLLKDPVMVRYAKMGTEQLARVMAQASAKADVLLMENHGVLTMGKTLLMAFEKLDVLDRTARMTVITKCMQQCGYQYKEIPPQELIALLV